jgi:hypothetical protein
MADEVRHPRYDDMKKSFLSAVCLLSLQFFAFAGDSLHEDVAKKALEAHGGEKLKSMSSLVVRGSAEISGSPAATFPATFSTVFAGDKYFLEIANPFQPLKQVHDGVNTESSVRGFSLPPLNRIGLPMLQRIGDKGFVVEALPERLRKRPGFRVVSPEGFFTDFIVDTKTGEIKSYESSFEIDGRVISTSVEVDRLKVVEGVKIPERYAQRFELGQLTFYISFKATEILVNSDLDQSIFKIN